MNRLKVSRITAVLRRMRPGMFWRSSSCQWSMKRLKLSVDIVRVVFFVDAVRVARVV